MAKWMLRRKSADFSEISRKFNIDPLLARLLVNRGVVTDDDFESYLNGAGVDILFVCCLVSEIGGIQ